MLIIIGTSTVKIMAERENNFEPICSVTSSWKGILAKVFSIDDRVFLSPLVDSNKIILSKHF